MRSGCFFATFINKTMERLLNDREGGSGNKTTHTPPTSDETLFSKIAIDYCRVKPPVCQADLIKM